MLLIKLLYNLLISGNIFFISVSIFSFNVLKAVAIVLIRVFTGSGPSGPLDNASKLVVKKLPQFPNFTVACLVAITVLKCANICIPNVRHFFNSIS